MEPEEATKNINDEPYAVRINIGWRVNGPLRNYEATRDKVTYTT